ncbi:hypothetical protein CC80DRAFT_489894 [Byssothecium circinans]|uniref:EthD domain-containing protein n=1 Tax=Byssothecium circinans TaxID=147558 RepID=A0A6A5U656_9PLEO|nr:hypothetical protein CC80DRAFT_489894 [Byssothecium circinans]
MAYTVLTFFTRNPSMTPDEFKDYWENKNIPLMQALLGDLFPIQYRRHYLARIERKGFGGPANPDHPPLMLRGSPNDFPLDGIAEMTWEDEKTFQKFYKAIHETDTALKLAKDEDLFLEPGTMKAVVVGDSTFTGR